MMTLEASQRVFIFKTLKKNMVESEGPWNTILQVNEITEIFKNNKRLIHFLILVP